MRACVLLNLINELEKRDKMRGLQSIFSLFRNKFNKFNNTRARMLDSIKITLKSHFWCKKVIIASLCTQRCYGRHNCKPHVVYRLYCIEDIYFFEVNTKYISSSVLKTSEFS